MDSRGKRLARTIAGPRGAWLGKLTGVIFPSPPHWAPSVAGAGGLQGCGGRNSSAEPGAACFYFMASRIATSLVISFGTIRSYSGWQRGESSDRARPINVSNAPPQIVVQTCPAHGNTTLSCPKWKVVAPGSPFLVDLPGSGVAWGRTPCCAAACPVFTVSVPWHTKDHRDII